MSMERGLTKEKNKGLGIDDKFDVVRDEEGEWWEMIVGRWVGCNWVSSQYQNRKFDVNSKGNGELFPYGFLLKVFHEECDLIGKDTGNNVGDGKD